MLRPPTIGQWPTGLAMLALIAGCAQPQAAPPTATPPPPTAAAKPTAPAAAATTAPTTAAATRLAQTAPAAGGPVKLTNGGDNDEFDVKVTVKIEGGSGDPITLSDTIDQIAPKASATSNLALEESPPLGAAVTIRVRVAPVPGEEKTDNNQAEYQGLFAEG